MSLRSLLSLLSLLLALPSAASGLSPEEARGKRIYALGTSASGVEIEAVLGDEGALLPASALPCAGCHGREGHGGKEGGIRPSDLTFEALGRPAAGAGRRHSAYDDRLLIRAVTLGADPAGNRLHVAMPRYRLTQRDAADLLAYLKRLGHEDEPGLEPTAVHLGVLLPGGARAEEAAEVRAVLTARGAEIDRGGGIYGRRLALDFVTLPEPPAERAAKLRELLAGEGRWFAMIGTCLSGAEGEMAEAAEAAGVPLLSTLAARPPEGAPPGRYAFYLTSGLGEQVEALIEAAARKLPPAERSLAIVPPGPAELAGIGAAAEAAARRRGFKIAASDGAAAILLLDRGAAAKALLRREETLGRRPLILLPGALPGEDLFTLVPAPLGDHLLISLPVLPARSAPAQTAALAAAEVLIEGLRRAGREVSRESLVATLEKLYRFDAGLGAPVTFGPNRRLGARGAFVTGIDFPHRALGVGASWIELAD